MQSSVAAIRERNARGAAQQFRAKGTQVSRSASLSTRLIAVVSFLLPMFVSGCARGPQLTEPLHDRTHKFDIFWPPIDPEAARTGVRRPLLHGNIAIEDAIATGDDCALDITVTITRPSTESDREFWNSQLEFANLPWMDEVRVWDSAAKWQWPNLPFLLRRSGIERVDRYGGVDPGKRVDNDFAAVIVRKFDAEGIESRSTQDAPLVSAAWRRRPGDRRSLVNAHRQIRQIYGACRTKCRSFRWKTETVANLRGFPGISSSSVVAERRRVGRGRTRVL